MQLRLNDMCYVGIEPYGEYGQWVVGFDTEYDIIKLMEDLLNSNATSFGVNINTKKVKVLVPKGFELERIL